jgi:hypothetical protein
MHTPRPKQIFVFCLVIVIIKKGTNNKPKPPHLRYGLSVHTKIYPIIYCIPFFIAAGLKQKSGATAHKSKMFFRQLFGQVNKSSIIFTIVSATTFLSITAAFYLLYVFIVTHTMQYFIFPTPIFPSSSSSSSSSPIDMDIIICLKLIYIILFARITDTITQCTFIKYI